MDRLDGQPAVAYYYGAKDWAARALSFPGALRLDDSDR
jgi:hypothetical protein